MPLQCKYKIYRINSLAIECYTIKPALVKLALLIFIRIYYRIKISVDLEGSNPGQSADTLI